MPISTHRIRDLVRPNGYCPGITSYGYYIDDGDAARTINGLQEHVMVADIDDDLIISTSKLAREQFWTVHPPKGLIPGVGVVVFRHSDDDQAGRIVMVGDNNMYTTPSDWSKYNVSVDIPDWTSLGSHLVADLSRSRIHIECTPLRLKAQKIQKIYGMEAFTIKQKVLFQQRIWFASKEQMMWHARHIPSYPLTVKQIEEHFDGTEVGKIRGHMQARHVTTRRLTDQEEQ